MDREGEGTKFTIDRKIFSSDIWFDSPWKLKIWIYLIGQANHKDGDFMGIEIKRGQLIRSYRTIRKDCGYKIGYRWKYPSLDTVRRICEDLTKDGRIQRQSVQPATLFTIINYNELQFTPGYRTKRRIDHIPDNDRTDTVLNNNDNNLKEQKKKEPSRLPEEEKTEMNSDKKLKEDLEDLCQVLYDTGVFIKAHAFRNTMLKKRKNEKAILHTLSRCLEKDNFCDDKAAWAYCTKIIQVEDGNYNEKDFQETQPKKQKRESEEKGDPEAIGDILKGTLNKQNS